ncbi:MAG: NRDE family protein [Deltaproteobacteria bacterium]|nr:NRDE family protein [Deltaproteobacteria bacterium]
MCTVVVLTTPAAELLIGFNRDELHSRRPALPPSRVQSMTGRYLAPTDQDAGGTWIGLTDQHLAVALLNCFCEAAPPREPVRSRGQLVRELLTWRTLYEADSHLRRLAYLQELHHYPPFDVLLAEPGAAGPTVHLARWNGARLVIRSKTAPFIHASSAWRTPAVLDERRASLKRYLATHPPDQRTAESLHQLLASHHSGVAERPPCIHGPWAHTVSHTALVVAGGQGSVRYAAGSPCQVDLGESQAV